MWSKDQHNPGLLSCNAFVEVHFALNWSLWPAEDCVFWQTLKYADMKHISLQGARLPRRVNGVWKLTAGLDVTHSDTVHIFHFIHWLLLANAKRTVRIVAMCDQSKFCLKMENVKKPTWYHIFGFESHSQIPEQGWNRSLNITCELKSGVQSLDLCDDRRTEPVLSHAQDTDGVFRSWPCDPSYIINSHEQHLARLLPNTETTGAFFWEKWNTSTSNTVCIFRHSKPRSFNTESHPAIKALQRKSRIIHFVKFYHMH